MGGWRNLRPLPSGCSNTRWPTYRDNPSVGKRGCSRVFSAPRLGMTWVEPRTGVGTGFIPGTPTRLPPRNLIYDPSVFVISTTDPDPIRSYKIQNDESHSTRPVVVVVMDLRTTFTSEYLRIRGDTLEYLVLDKNCIRIRVTLNSTHVTTSFSPLRPGIGREEVPYRDICVTRGGRGWSRVWKLWDFVTHSSLRGGTT